MNPANQQEANNNFILIYSLHPNSRILKSQSISSLTTIIEEIRKIYDIK
jgi:hypothetical protein